jgi:hypothetical protein
MGAGAGSDPQRLSGVLSELIALRGLARVQAGSQLEAAWKDAAGSDVAKATQVQGIKRGVLQVSVDNAPLLGELASYHKSTILTALQERNPHLKLRDLKFALKGKLKR